MFQRLLNSNFIGKVFRMFSARRHGYAGHHAFSRGWGSRHELSSNLGGLFGGLHRRRRSFI